MSRIDGPPPGRSMLGAIAEHLNAHRMVYQAGRWVCRCGLALGTKTADRQRRDLILSNHELHLAGVLSAAGMSLPVGDPRERFLNRQRGGRP